MTRMIKIIMNSSSSLSLRKILHTSLWGVFIFQFLLTSCGRVSEAPPKREAIALKEECKLVTDNLSHILKQDVAKDIECLENNLKKFVFHVKTQSNRDGLEKGELSLFVSRFFPKKTKSLKNGMDLLFMINALINQDDPLYIPEHRISQVMSWLRIINHHAVIIRRLALSAKDPTLNRQRFLQIRSQFEKEFRLLQSNLKATAPPIKLTTPEQPIPFHFFLFELNKRLKDITLDELKIHVIKSFKVLFSGGHQEQLRRHEFYDILNKLPEIALSLFDARFLRPELYSSQVNFFNELNHSILRFEKLLLRDGNNPKLFEIVKINNFIHQFTKREDLGKITDAVEAHILKIPDYQRLEGSEERLTKKQFLFLFYALKSTSEILYTQEALSPHLYGLTPQQESPIDVSEQQLSTKTAKDIPIQTKREKRTFIIKEIENLSNRLLLNFERGELPQKIDAIAFLKKINKIVYGNEFENKYFTFITFLKTFFLGGNPETLTKEDIKGLLSKLQQLIEISFNLYYIFPYEAFGPNHFLEAYKTTKGLQALSLMNEQQAQSQETIAISDVLFLLQKLKIVPAQDDADKITQGLKIIKHRILSTETAPSPHNLVTQLDFKFVLEFLKNLFEELYFNEVTFVQHFDQLKTVDKIEDIHFKLNYISTLSPQRIEVLKEDFKDLIRRYRYYRPDWKSLPYYGFEFQRSLQGVRELTALKHFIKLIYRGYAKTDPQKGLSLKEVNDVLRDFRPIIEHFKMWTKDPENFAKNTSNLADLFQSQSNGDGFLGEVELQEYAVLVLGAVQVMKPFMDIMKQKCPSVQKDPNEPYQADPACYRPYFFPILFEDLGLQQQLPLLYDYYQKASKILVNEDDEPQKTEAQEYLEKVEVFARGEPEIAGPMVARDFILVFGAMLNIESTMIRLDENRDGVIKTQELVDHFNIYKDALMTKANISDQDLALSAFLFLVEHMKLPGWKGMELLSYHQKRKWLGPNNIIGKRINIGKLLYFLVKKP